MTNDPLIALLSEQIQICMLPSLKVDLDEVQTLPMHFKDYHSMLEQELPKLYDLLHKNEVVLLNDLPYQEVFTLRMNCDSCNLYSFIITDSSESRFVAL